MVITVGKNYKTFLSNAIIMGEGVGRLFAYGAKAAGKKVSDALADETFDVLCESWEQNFPHSEISEKDLYNLLTSDELQEEFENFDEDGTFDIEVLASKIEDLSEGYDIEIRDGKQIAKEVVRDARPNLPTETQIRFQTRMLQKYGREEEENQGKKIVINDDLDRDKTEKVYSNFFKVVEMPYRVKSAKTDYRKKSKVYKELGEDISPFILRDGRLYTFARLENSKNRLSDAVKGDYKTVKTGKWKEDEDKKYYLISLLNSHLSERFYELGAIRHKGDYRKHTYFFPLDDFDNKKKEAVWSPYKGDNTRFVSKPLGDGFVHRGVEARFTFVDEEVYLIVSPTQCYTKDGKKPVNDKLKNKLSSKSQNWNRNKQVRDNIKFWSCFLSQGKSNIQLGDVVVYAKPESYRMNCSREEDYYGSGLYSEKNRSSVKINLVEVD